MNVKLFADTNILVYAFDRGEPTKQVVAQELLRREGATGNIAVSTHHSLIQKKSFRFK